jgi:hypothetical protein
MDLQSGLAIAHALCFFIVWLVGISCAKGRCLAVSYHSAKGIFMGRLNWQVVKKIGVDGCSRKVRLFSSLV